MDRIYVARRHVDGRTTIMVASAEGERPLDLRLDLRSHSPTGFEWGYGGSGPAQTALAILADAIGDARAIELYQDFKWKLIGSAPREGFRLSHDDVLATISEIESEAA